jgi:integrase
MTTHQFRHLAAKLYLDAHPGDYETVRQLLGHKTIQTTLRFYYELDKIFAAKRYSDLVDKLLDEHEGNGGEDDAT